MRMFGSTKAVSTFIMILLMIIAAIVGGIISYMFTIPQYTDIPQGTTLAITGVYFDIQNAASFKVGVLNPSYSSSNATIASIAVSVGGESTLYNITETEPSIENGTVLQKGQSINITCSKVRENGTDISWGRFAGEYAGRSIVVSVFSSDSPAANKELTLPFVKLYVSSTSFNPRVSFKNFSITLAMDGSSEINLTASEILVPGIDDALMKAPGLPFKITKDGVRFDFSGTWQGLKKTVLLISTSEGYSFAQELELQQAYPRIQNATFNEDYTDHFNVTIFNFAETDTYVNITRITCTPENGTAVVNNYTSVGLVTNQSLVLKFDWDWKETRGKKISVVAYLLQDVETETFTTTTPSPIIIKVLNENEVFNLQDRTHFNITLQNHQSSLNAVNITRIMVKETGEEINGTLAIPQIPYGLIEPDQSASFNCTISDWKDWAGKNFTLIVYAMENQTSANYTSQFLFVLPSAELNITEVTNTEFGVARYLNITVESSSFSLWNLTLSKVTIRLQNQTVLTEDMAPENQTIIKPSETAVILWLFDWGKYPNTDIVVTVFTNEGVEASTTFHIP